MHEALIADVIDQDVDRGCLSEIVDCVIHAGIRTHCTYIVGAHKEMRGSVVIS